MRCELFERFAAFNGDCNEVRKAGHFVHARQIELARWQHANFATYDDRDVALGVAEECGEFFSACNAEQMRDAKGDIAIYLGQLLMANRISIEPLLVRIMPPLSPQALCATARASAAGRLCHVVLKRHQRIRGMEDDDKWRSTLVSMAAGILDRYQIEASDYLVTSDIVLARRWRKTA